MLNSIKKKLLVIGAGYAGITVVNKLNKNKNLEITLINKSMYHLHQTDIHKYISGKIAFNEIAFDLNEYSKNKKINLIVSNVKDVLFNEKEVLLENDEKIKYDYLVIATGSKSFFPKQIKNIEEYAQDLKDIEVLNKNRADFLDLIDENREDKNIAIIGGGLSGVEIALEFAQVLKKRKIDEKECQISLIEQFPEILPNMNPFLVQETQKACDDLNIKRYHGAFVNEVKNKTIYLSDGVELAFDMVIFLIGVSSEKLSNDKSVEVNIKNQFIVDKYLRLENQKDVFVIGDIAQTKDENGNFVLPTAQMAKLHGKLVAKNINNRLENMPLIENKLQTKGVMIDLARNKAVGIVQSLKVKGYLAYSLKRFVSKTHVKIFK